MSAILLLLAAAIFLPTAVILVGFARAWAKGEKVYG